VTLLWIDEKSRRRPRTLFLWLLIDRRIVYYRRISATTASQSDILLSKWNIFRKRVNYRAMSKRSRRISICQEQSLTLKLLIRQFGDGIDRDAAPTAYVQRFANNNSVPSDMKSSKVDHFDVSAMRSTEPDATINDATTLMVLMERQQRRIPHLLLQSFLFPSKCEAFCRRCLGGSGDHMADVTVNSSNGWKRKDRRSLSPNRGAGITKRGRNSSSSSLVLLLGEMTLIPLLFWLYSSPVLVHAQNAPVAAPVATSTPIVAINMTTTPNATDAPSAGAAAGMTTTVPTVAPMATFQPTNPATKPPTQSPTTTHRPTISRAPTNYPTTSVVSITKGTYRQIFTVALTVPDQFFNTTEVDAFQIVIEGYTARLVANTTVPLSLIRTDCTVTQQTGQIDPKSNSTVTAIDYECDYESHVANVTDFPTQYIAYVNSNSTGFAMDLRAAGLDFISVQDVGATFMQTTAPTASAKPSELPSFAPSSSAMPSPVPTAKPTEQPILPTALPMNTIETPQPTPNPSGGSRLPVGAIAVVVILVGLSVLAGLFLYYRSWKKKREENSTTLSPMMGTGGSTVGSRPPGSLFTSFRHNRPTEIRNGSINIVNDQEVISRCCRRESQVSMMIRETKMTEPKIYKMNSISTRIRIWNIFALMWRAT
jgi:hypothetical protein